MLNKFSFFLKEENINFMCENILGNSKINFYKRYELTKNNDISILLLIILFFLFI